MSSPESSKLKKSDEQTAEGEDMVNEKIFLEDREKKEKLEADQSEM